MLGVNTCTGIRFFNPQQLIRCEASSNYTWFFFADKKTVLVARTLGEYEKVLPAHFLRIHRSDIINISHVRKHDNLGNLWLSDGTRLIVSKRRKVAVIKTLQSFVI